MQRTKLVAALIVLGAFVAGGAVGIAGDRAMHANGRIVPNDDPRAYWNQVKDDWGLSASQRKILDSLMDAQHRKISMLYHPMRPALDSVNAQARAVSDSTLAQLRLVLTPDQQKKLDGMQEEQRRRDIERRARRDSDLAKIK